MREITSETVLRRIEKRCRDEITVWNNPQMSHPGPGALGECRGGVYANDEILVLCRQIRKELRCVR
jgi:hypothetical protein